MAGVFFAVVGVVTNKPRASAISGISDAVCLISALVGVVTNKPRIYVFVVFLMCFALRLLLLPRITGKEKSQRAYAVCR